MTDLEKEMQMLQGMDLSGTVSPVQQVAPVQANQTIAQPVANEQTVQAAAQVVQPSQTVMPVQPVQPVQTVVTNQPTQNYAPLNLDVAQNNIDSNEFVTIDMGQKVSTAVMDKLKGQKDEKKRVTIFMPWFDISDKKNSAMAVKRHYSQDLGSFVCFNGECCQYEDKAAVRYLFPVIEYPIANNDATRPLPETYGECKLKLLIAGNELYSSIADAYAAHGNSFDGYDLIMTCTEQQYQSFTVMATNDTARNNYQSFNKCVEKWKQVRDQAYTVVARKMDPEYYRNQKGLGFQGPTTPTDLPTMDAIMQ